MKKRFSGFGIIVIILSVFSACSNTISDEAISAFLSARSEYEAGQIDRAGEAFEEIYQKNPDFYQAGFLLGKTQFFSGQLESAAKTFRELAQSKPEFYDAHFWHARTLAQAGEIEKAKTEFEELLSFASQNSEIMYQLALIAIEQENLPEALDYLQRGRLYNEESSQLYIQLGRLYFQYGVHNRAIGELQTAQAILPADHSLQSGISNLISRIRATEESVQ